MGDLQYNSTGTNESLVIQQATKDNGCNVQESQGKNELILQTIIIIASGEDGLVDSLRLLLSDYEAHNARDLIQFLITAL